MSAIPIPDVLVEDALILTPASPTASQPTEPPMTDTTTSPIVEGHVHGYGRDHGRAADHLAYEAMTTSKDVIVAVGVLGNRNGDSFQALERSVENSKAVVGGLVTDSSFRNLEQFGLAGVQAEKLAAATDVLVQKTTGELVTQVTLTAKDAIIDAAKNAAAGALQAEKIAAAQALAAAECCCELKALILAQACNTNDKIRDQGDRVTALINSTESARQAVALVDAKIELSNSKQNEQFRAMLASLSVGTGK